MNEEDRQINLLLFTVYWNFHMHSVFHTLFLISHTCYTGLSFCIQHSMV
jgi:hypothetical protein